MTMLAEDQWMRALEHAQATRLAMAAVKGEMFSGRLSFADALEDDRAQSMEIGALVLAQRHWGRVKTRKLLGGVPVGEHRRVRDLTVREKGLLIARVEGR